MDNIVQLNLENTENENSASLWRHSSEDIKQMISIVSASANQVMLKMKPGLPKCVYQLNLYNNLSKKGLQLIVGKSQLNNCVEGEPMREIITVNGALVIECFVESDIVETHKRRVIFDLENNNRAKGMLINFSEQSHGSMVTLIDNTSVFH